MMKQEDRSEYLGLLSEIQKAIKDGESKTRETKERLHFLAEKLKNVNDQTIAVAQALMPAAKPISIAGRWHRSAALKYMKTPLGTDGSRLHPGRYHRKGSSGAIYITNDAGTAADERRLGVKEEMFITFPLELKFQKVLDLSDRKACEKAGVSHELLGIEWQFVQDILEETPYTQVIGDLARQNLFEAIHFESVRRQGTYNLVVFPEVMQINSHIKVYDPDRLLVKEYQCNPEDLIISGIVPLT